MLPPAPPFPPPYFFQPHFTFFFFPLKTTQLRTTSPRRRATSAARRQLSTQQPPPRLHHHRPPKPPQFRYKEHYRKKGVRHPLGNGGPGGFDPELSACTAAWGGGGWGGVGGRKSGVEIKMQIVVPPPTPGGVAVELHVAAAAAAASFVLQAPARGDPPAGRGAPGQRLVPPPQCFAASKGRGCFGGFFRFFFVLVGWFVGVF